MPAKALSDTGLFLVSFNSMAGSLSPNFNCALAADIVASTVKNNMIFFILIQLGFSGCGDYKYHQPFKFHYNFIAIPFGFLPTIKSFTFACVAAFITVTVFEP